MNVLLVALGGAIGSAARYVLAGLVHRFSSPYFPYGTFTVNLAGCFVFGAIISVSEQRAAVSPTARTFLLIGVLGGFTTFSSFTYETFGLLRDGEIFRASINVAGQVLLGLVALWAGYNAANAL